MKNPVNSAIATLVESSAKLVAVAIEAAEDGVTAEELPAIKAHAGHLQKLAAELLDRATSQANKAELEKKGGTA